MLIIHERFDEKISYPTVECLESKECMMMNENKSLLFFKVFEYSTTYFALGSIDKFIDFDAQPLLMNLVHLATQLLKKINTIYLEMLS